MRGRADLGQPRLRHRVAEPVDRLQQLQFPLVRGGPDRDSPLQVIDGGVEQHDPVAVQPAQRRVVVGEPPGQRLGQVGELARGAHPADRQVRQDLPAPLPVDQGLDHQRRRLAGQVRHHRVQLDPRSGSSALASRWISEVRACTVLAR